MSSQLFPDFNDLVESLWRHGGMSRRALRDFATRLKGPGDFYQVEADRLRKRWPRLTTQEQEALDAAHRQRLGSTTNYLSFRDLRYPTKLERLSDPPCGFYFRGCREALEHPGPWIGVVGTRHASVDALHYCERMVEVLKVASPVIVSGLAIGIDGAAHRSALRSGLKTVGVLGSGLDRIYPTRHRSLAQDMTREGLLLSELAPGTPTYAWHFPQRNRLIAALSDLLVVVEAPEKSGALITADFALDIGIDIYVVPGRAISAQNRGGHRLIQQGAHLLMDPEEILWDLGIRPPTRKKAENNTQVSAPTSRIDPRSLSEQEQNILKSIGFQPVHVDKIIDMSHLAPAQVMGLLQRLVLGAWLEEWPGKCFGLHPSARELLSKP